VEERRILGLIIPVAIITAVIPLLVTDIDFHHQSAVLSFSASLLPIGCMTVNVIILSIHSPRGTDPGSSTTARPQEKQRFRLILSSVGLETSRIRPLIITFSALPTQYPQLAPSS
jgi:hypothetical protein